MFADFKDYFDISYAPSAETSAMLFCYKHFSKQTADVTADAS